LLIYVLLGCDEVVKKIPCRVISTAAFSKTSAGSSSSKHQHESSGVAVVDVRLEYIGNPAGNPESFNIDMGILNGFPIGQTLDCYA